MFQAVSHPNTNQTQPSLASKIRHTEGGMATACNSSSQDSCLHVDQDYKVMTRSKDTDKKNYDSLKC